jgi:hypothetical protein
MPIFFIVIGIAVLLGIGSYILRPEDAISPTPDIVATPEPKKENETIPDATTTPVENTTPANQTAPAPVATTPPQPPVVAPTPTTPTTPATMYSNGIHTVTTSYVAPGNANHTVTVALTLDNDVVKDATITYGGDKVETSSNYQRKFSDNYKKIVIGKPIDTLSLSRVGGASLTTKAFNEAVVAIKTEAKN